MDHPSTTFGDDQHLSPSVDQRIPTLHQLCIYGPAVYSDVLKVCDPFRSVALRRITVRLITKVLENGNIEGTVTMRVEISIGGSVCYGNSHRRVNRLLDKAQERIFCTKLSFHLLQILREMSIRCQHIQRTKQTDLKG